MFLFKYPIVAITATKHFIIDRNKTEQCLRVTGPEEYWSLEALLKIQDLRIQLCPTHYNKFHIPAWGIVTLQKLRQYNVSFCTNGDGVLLFPHGSLLIFADILKNRQRIKTFTHILPLNYQHPNNNTMISTAPSNQPLAIAVASATAMEPPPKKRGRPIKYECCICGKTSRDFCIIEHSDEVIDSTDMIVLCGESQLEKVCDNEEHHFVCGECVIDNFKHNNCLPSCPVCMKSNPVEEPLIFYDALKIMSMHDPMFQESCLKEIDFTEVPDIITMEWIDEHIQEDTLLYKLCERYWIYQQNTKITCACHCNCDQNNNTNNTNNIGVVDFETDTVDFSQNNKEFAVEVFNPQTQTIEIVWRSHPRLCLDCLMYPHSGKCMVTQHSINPYYRAPTKAQSIGKLFRNRRISEAMIKQFILNIWERKTFFITCPGCHRDVCRADKCNELACSCGFKLCSSCGYAKYSPLPLMGHYTSNIKAHPKSCPRYEKQNGVINGLSYPCSAYCQSAAHDCNVASHQPYKKALTKKQKLQCIARFIQALDIQKRLFALAYCSHNKINFDDNTFFHFGHSPSNDSSNGSSNGPLPSATI
tara:strand:+ start:11998 stop:13758 length:1761 start_codon:yes stop_codon:yes gene_type:complete